MKAVYTKPHPVSPHRKVAKWRESWSKSARLWRLNIEIARFINTQCIGFGLCLNWNYKPSIELEVIQWRLHIEYSKR